MKLNTTALTVLLSISAVAVGCSSKDDPKAPVSSAAGGGSGSGKAGGSGSGDIQGYWTDKSHVDLWQKYLSGDATAEEACAVYISKEGEELTRYFYGALIHLEGTQASSCTWTKNWESTCKDDGTLSGMTVSGAGEEKNVSAEFQLTDEDTMEFASITIDGKTYSKEEANAAGGELVPLTRIKKDAVSELNRFKLETCNLPDDPSLLE